ncbi:MAG: ABC transporter substrate-binding protein [Deltaproteobacteria bacterium]|nr:ABC transporter substrate-binding protein [Deltaproteobacteria bacterium]
MPRIAAVLRAGAREFDAKYEKQYNVKPPYHAAQAYASAYVAADVLKRATSPDREAVREALAATDVMTIYGRVTFGNYGAFKQQTKLSTLVLQVQKKKFEIVYPPSAATAKWVYPVPNGAKGGRIKGREGAKAPFARGGTFYLDTGGPFR